MSGPTVGSVPGWLRWRYAIALSLAVLVTPVLWLSRNALSDRARFEHVQAQRLEREHELYIATGWLYVDEAKRQLPLVAFENAHAAGTVTAMRAFLQKYPGSPYQEEARAILHEAYQEALQAFSEQGPKSNPRLMAFIEALLTHLEVNDLPTVAVRVETPSERDLEAADRRLESQAASLGGSAAPIAPHFTPESAAQRESQIVSQINNGLLTIFPQDVMTLRQVGQAGAGELEPVIAIRYAVTPSGDYYSSESRSTRVFVGIRIDFRIGMSIPDTDHEYAFRLSVEPPSRFTVDYSGGAGPNDSSVYRVMGDRAFDRLSNRLRTVLFDESSEAFKRSAS